MLLGGFLSELNWNYIYIFHFIALIIAIILGAFLFEVEVTPHKEEKHRSVFQDLITFSKERKGKVLLIFLIAIGLYNSVMYPAYMYGQNLFSYFDLSERYISIIFGGVQLGSGLIYLTADWVAVRISFRRLLATTFLGSSLLLFIHIFNYLPLSLVAFLAITILPEVTNIIIENFIQDHTPSRIRASVISVGSAISSVCIAFGYALYAIIADQLGIITSYVVMGVTPIASLGLILYFFHKSKGIID